MDWEKFREQMTNDAFRLKLLGYVRMYNTATAALDELLGPRDADGTWGM